MTATPPILSVRDVQEELRYIHRHRHRARSTAIYGSPRAPIGDAPPIDVEVEGRTLRFGLRHARCELELREALVDAEETPLVVLLEYLPQRLPADLNGRLASGAVYTVAPGRRIARLFGAQVATDSLLGCEPLCAALLDDPDPRFGTVTGMAVDLDDAWRALLTTRARFPEQWPLSEERLLEHAVRDTGGGAFAGYVQSRPGLAEALERYIEGKAGAVGALVLRAWMQGLGPSATAMAFVLEAASSRLETDQALRIGLKAMLKPFGTAVVDLVSNGQFVLRRWGALASPLHLRLESDPLREILAEADRLAGEEELAASLADSRYLGVAFRRACESLAGAMAAWTEGRTTARFKAARQALERVESHRLKDQPPWNHLVERARMALRLMAYVHVRDARPGETFGGSMSEPMLSRAEDYLSDGGFVDVARRVARGGADGPLESSIQRVAQTVDALRDADDEAFARALVEWNRNGRESGRVVPIERALEKILVPFLEKSPDRKALVLLLDGMSWAAGIQLLADLEDHYQWSPLRWRAPGASGVRLVPPMIAALPTITEVSRSSFFAGELIAGTKATTTANDPQRFASHAKLTRALGETPRLLIAPNATDPSGEASRAALELIESGERVVGIVVNAIDDQLKAGRQVRIQWTVQAIRPLQALLDKARSADRAVFLVADHGHVSGSRLQRIMEAPGGTPARWRALLQGEQAAENELVFEGDFAWRPRGRDRVALLFRETDCYLAAAKDGEHGGASIAEVVTPAILLGWDGLATSGNKPDADLERVPLPRPVWWNLEVIDSGTAPVTARAAKSVQPPAHSPQLPLFQPPIETAPVPTPTTARATESPIRAKLEATTAFGKFTGDRRRHYLEVVVPTLVALSDAGGLLSEDAFAMRMKIVPQRLRGQISLVQEFVNVDGLGVVEHDTTARQIKVHLDLLEQIVGATR